MAVQGPDRIVRVIEEHSAIVEAMWSRDRTAALHALEPFGPEPAESPRRGLYIAFQRVGLGRRWRCLHCGAAGTGHTDELALAAAVAHPRADEEARDE